MAFYAQPGAQSPPNQPQPGPQPGPYGQYPPQPQLPASNIIQVLPGSHSVPTALLLSLLCITGAGQMFNKQVLKGLVILIVALIAAGITGGVSILVIYPAAAVDAYMIASKLNRGQPVKSFEFF